MLKVYKYENIYISFLATGSPAIDRGMQSDGLSSPTNRILLFKLISVRGI